MNYMIALLNLVAILMKSQLKCPLKQIIIYVYLPLCNFYLRDKTANTPLLNSYIFIQICDIFIQTVNRGDNTDVIAVLRLRKH